MSMFDKLFLKSDSYLNFLLKQALMTYNDI